MDLSKLKVPCYICAVPSTKTCNRCKQARNIGLLTNAFAIHRRIFLQKTAIRTLQLLGTWMTAKSVPLHFLIYIQNKRIVADLHPIRDLQGKPPFVVFYVKLTGDVNHRSMFKIVNEVTYLSYDMLHKRPNELYKIIDGKEKPENHLFALFIVLSSENEVAGALVCQSRIYAKDFYEDIRKIGYPDHEIDRYKMWELSIDFNVEGFDNSIRILIFDWNPNN